MDLISTSKYVKKCFMLGVSFKFSILFLRVFCGRCFIFRGTQCKRRERVAPPPFLQADFHVIFHVI